MNLSPPFIRVPLFNYTTLLLWTLFFLFFFCSSIVSTVQRVSRATCHYIVCYYSVFHPTLHSMQPSDKSSQHEKSYFVFVIMNNNFNPRTNGPPAAQLGPQQGQYQGAVPQGAPYQGVQASLIPQGGLQGPQGPQMMNRPMQQRLPQPQPRLEQNKMVGVAQYFPSNKQFEPEAFTEDEFVNIQTALDKTLGPEWVSSRPGGGGTSVQYLEGWKLLNLANEVFGFNGWSSELVGYTLDYCDVSRDGKVSLGLSVVVRVTIKDGTYHEDIGYGFIDNAKNKASAYEKCKKEALTDGLKRCLRCFGNVLGNCLYDKALVLKLKDVEKQQRDLKDTDLYRDDTWVKLREQRLHTHSVNIMPPTAPSTATNAPTEGLMKKVDAFNAFSDDDFDDSLMEKHEKLDDYDSDLMMSDKKEIEPPVTGFVSAKKADVLRDDPTSEIPQFNPKASNSIFKTVDPTKSIPVKRLDIPARASHSPQPLRPINTNSPGLAPGAKRLMGMPPTPASKRNKSS